MLQTIKKLHFLIGLFTVITYAQQTLDISGEVKDGNQIPIQGVKVTSIKTGVTTYTDEKGTFNLQVPANTWLEFSHKDFESLEEPATTRMNVILMRKAVLLDEVLIKADPLNDITHSVTVTDDITKGSQPRNVADMFKDIPGINIQKRSATSMEPSLRAFKYEQMNVKYNGASKVVNACPNRMDPATAHVIPESVERIEIIKGPYTVRYGQIFGGMVNLVTNTLPAEGIHANLQTGYETNGTNYLGRGEFTYRKGKFDLGLDGEYRNFSDYTDGDGIIIPSGFITKSYSVKFGYNPTEKQRLQINWHQKFGSEIKHAGLMMDSPKDDSNILAVDYRINHLSGVLKSFTFKSYYSFVDHLMTNGYGMDDPRPNYPGIDARTPVTSETFGGKLEFKLQPNQKLVVYTGIDSDVIFRDGEKTVIVNINPNTGVPYNTPMVKTLKVWQDAYIYDFGTFIEAHYTYNDRLRFTFGLRSDYVVSDALDADPGFIQIYGEEVPESTDVTLGGSITAKYNLEGWRLQAALGRGTRTPSMVERYIYRFTVGNDGRPYIGNPYLNPEINNQIEISVRKRWDKFAFGTGVFYSYLKDFITPVLTPALISNEGGCGGGPPLSPKQFQNVDAYQYGLDFDFSYRFTTGMSIRTGGAWTHTYNTTLNEPLAQIAPPAVHAGITYKKKKYTLDLTSEWVAAQENYATSFGESRTPGHYTMDFRAVWKPLKGLSVGGAVLNILDEAYYNHVNFGFVNADEYNGRPIYEPGRSFSTYIKYQF